MPRPSPDVEARAIRIPEESTMPQPATHYAEAVINGTTTTVRASVDEAKRRGWKIIKPINPSSPKHKSRTATPPEPSEPAPATPDDAKAVDLDLTPSDERQALTEALNGFNVDELQDQARELGLTGYSRLRKDELIDALIDARA